jgi:hypothetical protein
LADGIQLRKAALMLRREVLTSSGHTGHDVALHIGGPRSGCNSLLAGGPLGLTEKGSSHLWVSMMGPRGRPFDSAAPVWKTTSVSEALVASGLAGAMTTGLTGPMCLASKRRIQSHFSVLWPRLGVGNRTLLPPLHGRGACFTGVETFHDWPKNCDQVLLVYLILQIPAQVVQPDQVLRAEVSCPPRPARPC